MRPQTKFQKETLDAICAIVAETGRAATLQEVAQRTGKSVTTVHAQARALRAQGLILPDRGLQPTDGRYRTGWRDGVDYLGKEVRRIVAEHHGGPAMERAVEDAVAGAAEAAGEKP